MELEDTGIEDVMGDEEHVEIHGPFFYWKMTQDSYP